MPTLAEFRAQYPMYADVSDGDLISALAQRGVTIEQPPPPPPGILSRIGTEAARFRDQIGRGAYTAIEREARAAGFDSVADYARTQQEVREQGLRESQGQGLPPLSLRELWNDPSQILTGNTAQGVLGTLMQAGMTVPFALNPLGMGILGSSYYGENLREQAEAQGIPLEQTQRLPAIAGAAGQVALDRFLGVEPMLARRMGGEAITGTFGQRVLRQGAIGAVGEAIQEGAQEAIQIAQGDISRPIERLTDPENAWRVADSAFAGAVGGGGLRASLAGLSPGRVSAPEGAPMTMEEAIAILQRNAPTPTAGTVQGGPNVPGVMGDAMRAPAVALSPELAQAIQAGDAYERQIAMAAVPEEQRINALNLYRQARATRVANLEAGIERPPGATISPTDPRVAGQGDGTAPLPPTPAPALAPPEMPREAARSPVDDMVAGMTPDDAPNRIDAATLGATPQVAPEAPATAQPPSQQEPPSAAPAAPAPEQVQQAERVIAEAVDRMGRRGAQGKRAAEAALATITARNSADPAGFLYAAPQVAVAFQMMDALSEIAPSRLGQAVEFIDAVISQRTGQPIQGTQERAPAMTEDGLTGLIRLSMDPQYAGFARETAAHEGMHAIWDWFRKTDPKVFRALQAAYPVEADGTVQLNRIDNSILRLLKRNVRPDGQSYYDYLAAQDYGQGRGVYLNQDEANAVTFGAIYDLTKQGRPANSLKPLLLRAFNFFSDMMDRLRASPNRRLLEDVATGRFREREGERRADISQEGLTDAPPTLSQPGADPAAEEPRPSARLNPAAEATRSVRRALTAGRGPDASAWSIAGEGGGVGAGGVIHALSLRDYDAAGVVAPQVVEMPAGQDSALAFSGAMERAKAASPFGAAVYVYSTDEYENMRLFLSPDGNAGFALKPGGTRADGVEIVDIVSVFSNPAGGYRSASYPLIRLAVEQGGNKLDAFDTVLPRIYAANGFRVASRMRWNDEYAPDGWSKETFAEFNGGEPDVVFMAHDPNHYEEYRGSNEGVLVEDYDDAVRIQDAAIVAPPRESSRQTLTISTDEQLESKGLPETQWGMVRSAQIMGSMPEELLDARSRANMFVRGALDNPATRRPMVPLGEMMTGIEAFLPPSYKALINTLRGATDKNIPVYGTDHVLPTYTGADKKVHSEAGIRGRSSYTYFPNAAERGLINLDFAEMERIGIGPAHVLLHEALHAATNSRLIALDRAAQKGNRTAIRSLDALDRIRNHVWGRVQADRMESERLGAGSMYYVTRAKGQQGNTDIGRETPSRSEFIAEAFTSPQFQAYLSTIETTPEIQAALAAAGVTGQPKTVLQGFVDWLRSILNLSQDTALDDIFTLAPSLFNGPVALEPEIAPESVRESGRRLPPDVAQAYEKLVNNEAAGWMGRALERKPWKAGMRAKLAADVRRATVDMYADVEDVERRLTGLNRLSAETSGYIALWQAEDVDRFMDAEMRYGGQVVFKQDPRDPAISWFEVDRNPDGGMKWMADFIGSAKTAEEIPEMWRAFQVYAIARRGTNLRANGIITQVGAAERAAGASALRQFPEIAAAYQGYQRSNQKLMQMMVDTGVLSQNDADAFLRYNDYYPFYRAIPQTAGGEMKRIAGIGSKFKPKEIIGGDEKFMDDPITVIRNNRAYWLNAAMRNVAKAKVVNTGRRLGIVRPFNPTTDEDGGKINLRVAGKNYAFFTTDPMLASAIESYNGLDDQWKNFISVFGAPSRMLREFVTKNPTFMFYSNLIRDSASGWIASGANIIPVVSTYKGIIDYIKDDPDVRRYIELGHGGRNFPTEDTAFRNAGDLLSDSVRIEKGIYRVTTGGMLLDILKKGYSKLETMSEASDLATRIAIFKAGKDEGLSDQEAAWRAREIMNFTKHGRAQWLRVLSGLIPFTNARIQGMDVLVQSLAGQRTGDPVKTRNEKLGRAWFRGGLLMAIGLAAVAAFDDDDEVKDKPRWLRDTNTLIPLRALGLADQGVLAIPKPFEYGTLFMTIPENMLRVMMGTDTPRAVGRTMLPFGGGENINPIPPVLASSLAYNPIPTAVLPFVEQVANYSFFTGRPIIGRGVTDLSPELQYSRNTPGAYRALATAASDFFTSMGMPTPQVFSPARMEHFVRSWTGSVGTYFATAIGTLAGAEDMRGWDISRAPIVASMIRNERNTPPGGTDELYSLIEASDRVTRTMRIYAQAGDERRARALREANAELIQAQPEIRRLRTQQTRISQRRREIMRDTRLSEGAKRTQLDALDAAMRELTRSAEAIRLRAGQ